MGTGGRQPLKSDMLWLGSEPFSIKATVLNNIIPPSESYYFLVCLLFKMAVFVHVAKFTYNKMSTLSVHSVSSSRSANTCVPQTVLKTYNSVTPKQLLFWLSTLVFPIWGLHINGITCRFLCVRLLRLIMMMFSSIIHVACISSPFLFIAESVPLCKCSTGKGFYKFWGVFGVDFAIYFPDGHLVISSFCPNKVAKNILVQVLLRMHVFIPLD